MDADYQQETLLNNLIDAEVVEQDLRQQLLPLLLEWREAKRQRIIARRRLRQFGAGVPVANQTMGMCQVQ